MQLSAAELAHELRNNNIDVQVSREGSLDVEGEVQLNPRLLVTVCNVTGTFSVLEILNEDPDASDMRTSKRISSIGELLKVVRLKTKEQNGTRKSRVG